MTEFGPAAARVVEQPLGNGHAVTDGGEQERRAIEPGVIELGIEAEHRGGGALREAAPQPVGRLRAAEVEGIAINPMGQQEFADILGATDVVLMPLMTDDQPAPPL